MHEVSDHLPSCRHGSRAAGLVAQDTDMVPPDTAGLGPGTCGEERAFRDSSEGRGVAARRRRHARGPHHLPSGFTAHLQC